MNPSVAFARFEILRLRRMLAKVCSGRPEDLHDPVLNPEGVRCVPPGWRLIHPDEDLDPESDHLALNYRAHDPKTPMEDLLADPIVVAPFGVWEVFDPNHPAERGLWLRRADGLGRNARWTYITRPRAPMLS